MRGGERRGGERGEERCGKERGEEDKEKSSEVRRDGLGREKNQKTR